MTPTTPAPSAATPLWLLLRDLRSQAAGRYEDENQFGDGGYTVSVFLSGYDAAAAAGFPCAPNRNAINQRSLAELQFRKVLTWGSVDVAAAHYLAGWDAAVNTEITVTPAATEPAAAPAQRSGDDNAAADHYLGAWEEFDL